MTKYRRTDINFIAATSVTQYRVVDMTLSLTNNSPNDYWTAETAVLRSRDISSIPAFSISGPSEVMCSYMLRATTHKKYDIQLLNIPQGETISHSLRLSDLCYFEHALPGIYTVRFSGSFYLYNNSNKESHFTEKLGGNSEEYYWRIGNSSFLIGETRDTTVSESLSHADSL
jgi:hypothetical protein